MYLGDIWLVFVCIWGGICVWLVWLSSVWLHRRESIPFLFFLDITLVFLMGGFPLTLFLNLVTLFMKREDLNLVFSTDNDNRWTMYFRTYGIPNRFLIFPLYFSYFRTLSYFPLLIPFNSARPEFLNCAELSVWLYYHFYV